MQVSVQLFKPFAVLVKLQWCLSLELIRKDPDIVHYLPAVGNAVSFFVYCLVAPSNLSTLIFVQTLQEQGILNLSIFVLP